MNLPVLVDGSKNPEKIPDSLAYHHFFSAVSAHPTPSAQEVARQNAQLLPLKLSATDQQKLVQGARRFSGRTRPDRGRAAIAIYGCPSRHSKAGERYAARQRNDDPQFVIDGGRFWQVGSICENSCQATRHHLRWGDAIEIENREKPLHMRTLRLLGFTIIPLLLGAAPLAAQCTEAFTFSVYNEGSVSFDASTVYGYTSTIDSSTLCSCAHSAYMAYANLYDSNGTLLGSSGEAGFSSSVSALTDGVSGGYGSSGAGTAFCSCLEGYFGGGGTSYSITPPAPRITGIADNATWDSTIYQGTSGYLAIFGTALTAWGETPTPSVSGDSGLLLGERYAS